MLSFPRLPSVGRARGKKNFEGVRLFLCVEQMVHWQSSSRRTYCRSSSGMDVSVREGMRERGRWLSDSREYRRPSDCVVVVTVSRLSGLHPTTEPTFSLLELWLD